MSAHRSRPVLLCYDGSEGARNAIAEAGALTGGGPALVVSAWECLDSVVTPVPGLAGMTAVGVTNLNEEAAAAAVRLATEAVELAKQAGFDAEPLPLRASSRVWRAILEAARTHDVRAIVIGSRGLSGVAALLGSVAYRVVHHSDRPVLLVPPAGSSEEEEASR